jgi:hypothetical protein
MWISDTTTLTETEYKHFKPITNHIIYTSGKLSTILQRL